MKETLKSILKKQMPIVFIILILVALNEYVLTIPSKVLGNIIDLLNNADENKPLIIQNIIILLYASVSFLVFRIIWKYLVARVTRMMEKILKDKLFEQFLKINLNSIQNIKNGELMSYLTKDVGEIKGLYYRILSHASRVILVFIIATYTMKNVNLSLTLATLCPIIITLYVIILLKKQVEKNFKKSQRYFTSLSEYVQESTDAIRTTKSYSGETNQLKKFIKKNTILKKGNIAVDVYSTLLSMSVSICFGFCYGITILYGSKLVLENKITIGQFVEFNGYIGLFITPISWIPGIVSKFERAQISYNRLERVFKLPQEELVLDDIENKDTIYGDIKIENLSFNYPENIDNVLDNINVTIPKGTSLGIIGTIGSGKTTLMNLLLKLYNVPDGKIFIDNKDINSLDLVRLRESICYITQDNFLFSTTIKENIRLFKDDFDDDEIRESTKKAMLADDLCNMDKDIYTVIGERGIDLSGGQKQRVVISRAFLNKAKIIIFDDTFSALDNKTEEKLLKNIKELVKDKICIIISNRISDVKDADHIIVLDSGKIIEEGTHNELLKNNGLYNKFYMQQASNDEELLS